MPHLPLNSLVSRILAAVALASSLVAFQAAAAGDAIVTESRGAVVKVTPKASVPVREWDALKEGDRVSVPAGGQVSIFFTPTATLYELSQPIEVVVNGGALQASSGTVPAPRNLHAAYRQLKVDSRELVQGSLVMRSGETVKLNSPEGLVPVQAAREFAWSPASGAWRLEIADAAGNAVFANEVSNGRFTLPGQVMLSPGVTYVWGIAPLSPRARPVDWTEFKLVDSGDDIALPNAPAAAAPRSEWLVYAAWLRAQGLNRAALRVAARAPAARYGK